MFSTEVIGNHSSALSYGGLYAPVAVVYSASPASFQHVAKRVISSFLKSSVVGDKVSTTIDAIHSWERCLMSASF